MDKKQIINSIVVAGVIVVLWWTTMHVLEKKYPQFFQAPAPAQVEQTPPSATQPATTAPGTTQPAVAGVPTTVPATAPTVATTPPAPAAPSAAIVAAGPAIPGRPVILGEPTPNVSENSPFAMGVVLNPTGAAIDSVTLNRFGRSAEQPKLPYVYQRPYADEPDSLSLAARSIVVNGTSIDLSQANWKVVPGNDSMHASFELPLLDSAGKPVATLIKTYRVSEASKDPKTSQGYELAVDLRVENQSAAPLSVQTEFNGPTMPPQENERYDDRAVLSAMPTAASTVAVTQHMVGEFKPGKADIDLPKDSVWAGEASAYFDALVLPEAITGGSSAKPQYAVKATALEPENANVENGERAVILTFTSDTETLAPGKTMSMPAAVFFGPKKEALLDSPYYAAFPRCYDQSLVIHGSYCGFLTFNWLVWTLVDVLWFFHAIFRDWGIAIICLVILVRLILHPITKKSQVNMMKMSKMGPEIERLKKKYGEDKDALNKAMMEVYKNQGPATILGCLPMFLQMPIWIALWGALQSTFELRQAPFLWKMTWIRDLSQPDGIPYLYFPHHAVTLPFFHFTIQSINILPVLMGVVFYLQQKYTPKPPAATPEQEQQQKMMQYMSLLFPLFLYNGPSGLNLYILTSTTIGVFENRIIRDHIKQREEAEKAGRVFVETKPTRAKKNLPVKTKNEAKKSKLGRWIGDLQSRAEQMQKEADRAKKRRET